MKRFAVKVFLPLFLSLLLLSSFSLVFADDGSNKFLYQTSSGTFDSCDEWRITSSGVKSGWCIMLWNSSNPSGYALRDNTGFNVHFDLSTVQCTNPPLNWTNWFTGMWDTSRKDINVNLTLCEIFSGKTLSNSFLIDSHSSLWGASGSTDLHYASFVNASVPLKFPNAIDLGFYRSGDSVTVYLQYIDEAVKFYNGTCAPVRLSNIVYPSSSLLSNGLLVMLEISHAGSGDVDVSFIGSETTVIPSGWDATETTKEVVGWWVGIANSLSSFGALFSALIGIVGVLVVNAPLLLFFFFLWMGLACLTSLSIEPLRRFTEFVWGIATGVVSALTGVIQTIKDLIQWW